MKTARTLISRLRLGLLLTTLLLGTATFAQAQPYNVGNIVGTNFGLQNRFRWTNDTGQVYTPSNTSIRLRDFDGKIVFFVFFDVW